MNSISNETVNPLFIHPLDEISAIFCESKECDDIVTIVFSINCILFSIDLNSKNCANMLSCIHQLRRGEKFALLKIDTSDNYVIIKLQEELLNGGRNNKGLQNGERSNQ